MTDDFVGSWIDNPSPFDTVETWERYIARLNSLPLNTVGRQGMIDHAKVMMEMKAEADRQRLARDSKSRRIAVVA